MDCDGDTIGVTVHLVWVHDGSVLGCSPSSAVLQILKIVTN